MLRLCLLAVLASMFAMAQTNGICVSASREAAYVPEEAAFQITVNAPGDATLDDVLSALKDLNLEAKDLVSINSATQRFDFQPDPNGLAYQFQMVASFARMKALQERVAAVRRALTEASSKISIGTLLIVVGPAAASREQVRQRLYPDLIADARRRGDAIAKAASLTLGPIVSTNELPLSSVGGILGFAVGNPVAVASNLREPVTLSVCFAAR